MQPSEAQEMRALFTRYGFVPSPECPERLLRAHVHLVYFILRAFASTPDAAASLIAAVAEWHRRYDELADAQPSEQVFEYSDGKRRLRLACSPGCSHCCTTPVSLIAPEAAAIAAYIQANQSGEQKAALAARMTAHTQALHDDPQRPAMCPLNVDGKCTVYPVRPLNCRKWHSFDEPACRRAFLAQDSTALIPRGAVRADASGLVWQSAVAAFSALGLSVRELDLIPALEIALHSEQVAARVLADDALFAPAQRQAASPEPATSS